jgi:ABC-type dipeptide/oligopeptide/nickel transport system permease component
VIGYLAQRVVVAFVQILVAVTLVFAFLHLLPGDPVLIILGSERSVEPEQIAAVRHTLGLDQPVPVQYANWLQQLVRLELGTSLVDNSPVRATIGERFPRTLELVMASTLLAVVVAVPMGVVAALRRNRAPDLLLSGASALGISLPVYVTGLLLVLFFGVVLRWLPTQGYVEFSDDPIDHLLHLALPAVVLAFGLAATVTRMTRSSLLEVLGQDYVRTARAKGVHEQRVVYGHALRNALIPVVTVIGIQVGALIGGAVLVEYIFNWPGMSTLLITAISRRDYPTVQGVVLVASAFLIFVNLGVDLLYGFLDPRIRRS